MDRDAAEVLVVAVAGWLFASEAPGLAQAAFGLWVVELLLTLEYLELQPLLEMSVAFGPLEPEEHWAAGRKHRFLDPQNLMLSLHPLRRAVAMGFAIQKRKTIKVAPSETKRCPVLP